MNRNSAAHGQHLRGDAKLVLFLAVAQQQTAVAQPSEPGYHHLPREAVEKRRFGRSDACGSERIVLFADDGASLAG